MEKVLGQQEEFQVSADQVRGGGRQRRIKQKVPHLTKDAGTRIRTLLLKRMVTTFKLLSSCTLKSSTAASMEAALSEVKPRKRKQSQQGWP